MTQEEKDLLVKDLCSRLPYEVKVQYEDGIFTLDHISAMYEEVKLNTPNNYTIDVLEVKPYLFPMSNMTEEQFNEKWELEHSGDMEHLSIPALDWLNKNHFDYRGLIPAGLAIDATGLNIY